MLCKNCGKEISNNMTCPHCQAAIGYTYEPVPEHLKFIYNLMCGEASDPTVDPMQDTVELGQAVELAMAAEAVDDIVSEETKEFPAVEAPILEASGVEAPETEEPELKAPEINVSDDIIQEILAEESEEDEPEEDFYEKHNAKIASGHKKKSVKSILIIAVAICFIAGFAVGFALTRTGKQKPQADVPAVESESTEESAVAAPAETKETAETAVETAAESVEESMAETIDAQGVFDKNAEESAETKPESEAAQPAEAVVIE